MTFVFGAQDMNLSIFVICDHIHTWSTKIYKYYTRSPSVKLNFLIHVSSVVYFIRFNLRIEFRDQEFCSFILINLDPGEAKFYALI